MGDSNLSVSWVDEGLLVSGVGADGNSEWSALDFGINKVLLEKSNSSSSNIQSDERAVLGRFTSFALVSLLHGLVNQGFSGLVAIEVSGSLKKLFFKNGELVFAGSNLIDDRLGEVIYRAGWITLEQLTDAAVQVNRTTKFGKVLIDNGVFSSSQLWEALKLQVSTIFESVFCADEVYVEVKEGEHLAPTAVSLSESTLVLIDEAQGFSAMLRGFVEKIQQNQVLAVNGEVLVSLDPPEGTFVRDTIELIQQHGRLEDFIVHSKLSRTTTLVSLFELVHRHLVVVRGQDASVRKMDRSGIFREIKNLLDAYHLILEGARKAFQAEGVSFPVRDIEVFLEREFKVNKSPLFVHPDGSIAPEGVEGIITQSRVSRRQSQRAERHLQGLILFLLQLVGDLLPSGRGWELKRNFQNMIT